MHLASPFQYSLCNAWSSLQGAPVPSARVPRPNQPGLVLISRTLWLCVLLFALVKFVPQDQLEAVHGSLKDTLDLGVMQMQQGTQAVFDRVQASSRYGAARAWCS
jgi:hypothetical protein